MKIVEEPINTDELLVLARKQFGDFVKAVVDVRRKILAIGGELHADEECLLIEHGSQQEDLWGINIYPQKPKSQRIEFDSMINIRPSRGNRSRIVEDERVRTRIDEIVNRLVV